MAHTPQTPTAANSAELQSSEGCPTLQQRPSQAVGDVLPPQAARGDIAALYCERYLACSNTVSGREIVLEALESFQMPISNRKNVRKAGDDKPILGMCLGLTASYFGGPMPSRHTREFPRLAELLCQFARRERPEFAFTSIQVNKDYAAALHVDKNDAGDSYIIGLGDYRGGQLWVDNGRRLGRVVDLHGRWLKLDGGNPHAVLPFTGRRYTIVFFSRAQGGDLGKDPNSPHAVRLLSLGFPLPCVMPRMRSHPPASERLARSRRKLEQYHRERGSPNHVSLLLQFPDASLKGSLSDSGSSSNSFVRVLVSKDSPLQRVADLLRQRLKSSTSGMCSRNVIVRFRLGMFDVLPSDTAETLGLRSEHVLQVFVEQLGPVARFAYASSPTPTRPPGKRLPCQGMDYSPEKPSRRRRIECPEHSEKK